MALTPPLRLPTADAISDSASNRWCRYLAHFVRKRVLATQKASDAMIQDMTLLAHLRRVALKALREEGCITGNDIMCACKVYSAHLLKFVACLTPRDLAAFMFVTQWECGGDQKKVFSYNDLRMELAYLLYNQIAMHTSRIRYTYTGDEDQEQYILCDARGHVMEALELTHTLESLMNEIRERPLAVTAAEDASRWGPKKEYMHADAVFLGVRLMRSVCEFSAQLLCVTIQMYSLGNLDVVQVEDVKELRSHFEGLCTKAQEVRAHAEAADRGSFSVEQADRLAADCECARCAVATWCAYMDDPLGTRLQSQLLTHMHQILDGFGLHQLQRVPFFAQLMQWALERHRLEMSDSRPARQPPVYPALCDPVQIFDTPEFDAALQRCRLPKPLLFMNWISGSDTPSCRAKVATLHKKTEHTRSEALELWDQAMQLVKEACVDKDLMGCAAWTRNDANIVTRASLGAIRATLDRVNESHAKMRDMASVLATDLGTLGLSACFRQMEQHAAHARKCRAVLDAVEVKVGRVDDALCNVDMEIQHSASGADFDAFVDTLKSYSPSGKAGGAIMKALNSIRGLMRSKFLMQEAAVSSNEVYLGEMERWVHQLRSSVNQIDDTVGAMAHNAYLKSTLCLHTCVCALDACEQSITAHCASLQSVLKFMYDNRGV